MKVGLYFGTFNPIHVGHLIIASHMAEFSDLDQIWMVVTPHNPHKTKSTLLDDYKRLEMVFLATENYPKIKPSNFYGTLNSEIERIWAMGKNVIFDIDVAGGLRIKKKFPEETLAVFVKPPSIDELKIRLKKRSTESEEKINMRIAKASVELATAPQFDKIIKNYDLDEAKNEAYMLVKDFLKD